jgi:hypothetical protein
MVNVTNEPRTETCGGEVGASTRQTNETTKQKEPDTMNATIRRTRNMLVGTDAFLEEHPLTPLVAKATEQITILKGSIAELATLAANQDAGNAEWNGAIDDRERLRLKLREELSAISAISKVLDPDTYPTARAQFKLTVNGSFASYITRGNAFLQAIGAIKAAFVEHGLAADLDETLAETVAQLEEAGTHRANALQTQMGGTAGMPEVAKRGVRAVRVLDSIVTPKLKSNPALLQVWKAATRIERGPRREEETVVAPGSGAGTGAAVVAV